MDGESMSLPSDTREFHCTTPDKTALGEWMLRGGAWPVEGVPHALHIYKSEGRWDKFHHTGPVSGFTL